MFMETAQTQKEQMEVAQMRFGIIAPLVQGTYTDGSMAAYCNAALYSRRKKHFIFDSINTITAPSFR